MSIDYTSGFLTLGKPSYKFNRFDLRINENFEVISRLGKQDENYGATLIGIPSDMQSTMFPACTNLRAALQYIYNNYMHATSGVWDAFEVEGVGLHGPVYRTYYCTENIKAYSTVYLVPRNDGKKWVGLSQMIVEATLPAIGIAITDGIRNEKVSVAVFGPVQNKEWDFKLPTSDTALKYIYVGDRGVPRQYETAKTEPKYGEQIIGLLESSNTIFLKPEITWRGIG